MDNMLTMVYAGLASWRKGDLKRARLFFSNLANLENSKESVRSAGAIGLQGLSFYIDNPSQAIEFLKISSKYPDTFYGKLSIQSLG